MSEGKLDKLLAMVAVLYMGIDCAVQYSYQAEISS